MKLLSKIKPFIPIFLIFILAVFVRSYRQDQLLGFYYDQGRDAKMASDIINARNFPAIGPTTGIQGLYLGPFWYYLITPGYFLSKGNPAVSSIFIVLLESLTIPLIYFLLIKHANKTAALLASFFWAFSNYLVRSSRWFSNPSPIPFFVVLLIYLLVEAVKNKKHTYWIYITFILGISLQLEAASAVFFIPVILLILILNFRTIKTVKLSIWIKSLFSFCILLLPQVAFELKNNFLVTNTFFGFLTGKVNSDTGRSWAIPAFEFIEKRLISYYHSFFSKLDTNVTTFSLVFLAIFIAGIIWLVIKKRQDSLVQILLAWLFIPLLLLLFFVGNYGTLYDYYLTGFFPAFIILFSLIVTLPRRGVNTILILFSLFYFYKGNYIYLRDYLRAGVDGPTHITLGNQLLSVDHICRQTQNQEYNLAVYVPPVIPHTYDYLFSWRSSQNLCKPASNHTQKSLYLLYEVDPEMPKRLETWLSGYSTLPLIDKKQFGGIFVEERLQSP